MMANKFDMNDMLTQFAQIRKMGGASALLAMMPGANQIKMCIRDSFLCYNFNACIFYSIKV